MEKIISQKIKIIFIFCLTAFLTFLTPAFSYADNLKNAFDKSGPLDKVAGENGAGYNTEAGPLGVNVSIGLIITTVIELVGVVFLVLAIYGGYLWMTARGNDETVEKAKNTLINAIIGLVIVLAAYAISWYVINALGGSTLK